MTTFKKTLIKDWPALLILLIPFILIGAFWNQIPSEIPMQWKANGEVSTWGEKGFDVFILPLAGLGVYLLILAIPYIDPKRKAKSQQKGIRAFRYIIPFLMTGIFMIILAQWIGLDLDLSKSIGLLLAIFFIAVGNYMQSIRPNYFLGIRTPWTLESEHIWRKTHRMGGRVWIIGGLLILLAGFLIPAESFLWGFTGGVLIMAFIPAVYSFYLYMQEKKENAEQPG